LRSTVNQFLVIAINKQPSSRRGPRTFDRDQAIQLAMRLFWRHGYEGVSINDLTNAIGIAPPSLYAAFGSKEALYREALDRYTGLPGALSNLSSAKTLHAMVKSLLCNAVDAVTDPSGERGCMISTGLIQCAPAHASLASELADRRRKMRDQIASALTSWLDRRAANSLARYLTAVMQGLAIQARDGATRADLEEMVNEVVAGLRARERKRRLSK
jgi:AcrR family transcriptional regulator